MTEPETYSVRQDVLDAREADPVYCAQYAVHSIIHVTSRVVWTACRYRVLSYAEGYYVLKPLSTTADNFDAVLWEFEECDRHSVLEWVDSVHHYGLIEPGGTEPRALSADELAELGMMPDDY